MTKHPETPIISVIVPAYNIGQYIGQTIDSVCRQTFPYWELVMVDDGSDDDTAEIIRAYAARDSRIRYFRSEKPRSGASHCRNLGFSVSRGEYVTYLDSDDLYYPDALEVLLEALHDNPGKRVSRGFYSSIDVDNNPIRTKGTDLIPMGSGEYAFPPNFQCDWFSVLDVRVSCSLCLGLYHRSIITDLGPMREDLSHSEDLEFFLRLYRRFASDLLLIPAYVVKVRFRPGSLTRCQTMAWRMLSCQLTVMDEFFADNTLPDAVKALKPLIYLRSYRCIARQQLNLSHKAIARDIAHQALRHPEVNAIPWIKAFYGIYLQSFFPESLYRFLADTNRNLHRRAYALVYLVARPPTVLDEHSSV